MSGRIFYGKSEDGSDMKEFEGVFVHPNGETWSNKPFVLTNPYAGLEIQKRFVCKGKHQYRKLEEKDVDDLIKIKWICQCGRSV